MKHPLPVMSNPKQAVLALAPAGDLDALGARWRALEARADPSFFQSWSWVGCLAAERFPDPVLLAGTQAGQDVALALFNRRPDGTLHLGESGDPALDGVYVEQNGPLADPRATDLPALLRAAAGRRRVVMSGVGDAWLDAARASGAAVRVRKSQPAPFVAFAALRPGDYLDSLGASTRYTLRRSARAYATRGELRVERAATAAQAHGFLDALAALHQRSWVARGLPGAFATPFFGRFHHALIDRAHGRGELDLLRVAAGAEAIGYLYLFRRGGRAAFYQSGLDYAGAVRHGKPGLTCHHLAIELYRREGLHRYDFLAGEHGYKALLANGTDPLHWIELAPRWSPRGLLWRAIRR